MTDFACQLYVAHSSVQQMMSIPEFSFGAGGFKDDLSLLTMQFIRSHQYSQSSLVSTSNAKIRSKILHGQTPCKQNMNENVYTSSNKYIMMWHWLNTIQYLLLFHRIQFNIYWCPHTYAGYQKVSNQNHVLTVDIIFNDDASNIGHEHHHLL